MSDVERAVQSREADELLFGDRRPERLWHRLGHAHLGSSGSSGGASPVFGEAGSSPGGGEAGLSRSLTRRSRTQLCPRHYTGGASGVPAGARGGCGARRRRRYRRAVRSSPRTSRRGRDISSGRGGWHGSGSRRTAAWRRAWHFWQVATTFSRLRCERGSLTGRMSWAPWQS